MANKHKIFFAWPGCNEDIQLTSTAANYAANLAKEYYQGYETDLDNIRFVTTSVSIIGTDHNTTIKEGWNSEHLGLVNNYIQKIAKAKQLIAWLREAIKAREELLKELKKINMEQWCELQNIELPYYPERLHVLTEEEFIAQQNIKWRSRYYSLETYAAVLGKFIHVNGKFSDARGDAKFKLQNPNEVYGSGRDTIIKTYKVSVPIESIDDKFFELQQKHREIQAELNSMRHEIQTATQESELYSTNVFEKNYKDYTEQTKELNAKFASWRQEQINALSNLKIVIPHQLKEIYREITSLGKK